MSYGGITPYQCLVGCHPRSIMNEEIETISCSDEQRLPFFQHQLVRARAIQSFHEGLMQERYQRVLRGRPRIENSANYKTGDLIDICVEPANKALSGWRGPATVTAVLADGLISARWQGDTKDWPIRMIRPHIPLIGPQMNLPDLSTLLVYTVSDIGDHDQHRKLYDDETISTLMMTINQAAANATFNHAVSVNNVGELVYTRDSMTDMHHIFRLGARGSLRMFDGQSIYRGLLMGKNRRTVPVTSGVAKSHLVYWQIGSHREYRVQVFPGNTSIDFEKFLNEKEHWKDCSYLCFLEADASLSRSSELDRMLSDAAPPVATEEQARRDEAQHRETMR